MASVLQPWVEELTIMQQSVLIAAVRGPDGLRKDHIAKAVLRWYRRCILLSAFEHAVIEDPYSPGGGSFTGPLAADLTWPNVCDSYMRTLDEIPHHFQLHLMHAAEIIGYKHPRLWIRDQWYAFYLALVADMHMFPESEELMDRRLGDSERQWREREAVVAHSPAGAPVVEGD